MRLKNDALRELYDALVNSAATMFSMSPYVDSPIDRAFKECDEKLSESAAFAHIKDLENRCENLERSNKALRDDNDKLGDKIIELKKKNENLGLALIEKGTENTTLISANADLSDRLAKLQRNFDRINHLWTSQIQENMELRSKITDLKKEIDGLQSRAGRAEAEVEDLKKKLDTKSKENSALIFTNAKLDKDLKDSWQNNDGWRSRALEAEKRVGELLLKKYDQAFEDLRKEHDRYSGLYTELKKDYDRLFEENRSLKGKFVDLKRRITELQKKGDDLTKKAVALQQEKEEMEKSRKCHRQLHVGEGARHLWGMLQNVNDSQPFEFDVECESMEDVIGMDLDDFLDAYKKWQEKKEQNETDRMRNWLAGFCDGNFCNGCPLESVEYKCGCGYSFKKANQFDTRIIPDEDIKRYYEKARGDGDATFKPEEEEHKLDYGDAVRVPWRDYDYMYIGPEGKHVRLFDPKTHTVIVVSVTDNLTYQGCKIILCDEDDIRKIWKDKK